MSPGTCPSSLNFPLWPEGFDSFLASVSHLFNKHAADVLAAEPLCVLASMMLDSIASRHAGEERRWPLV